AATQGRVLVLEGLEKAERNVLPVLNNLLENREMQLEDGRFLMSPERYDKLLQVRTACMSDTILNQSLLHFGNLIWHSELGKRKEHFPHAVLSAACPETLPLQEYPGKGWTYCCRECFECKGSGIKWVLSGHISSAYNENLSHCLLSLQRFELLDGRRQAAPSNVVSVSTSNEREGHADVTVQTADKEITFQVPAGSKELRPPNSSLTFINTPSHSQLLAEMMQSHMVKDLCLIGAKGCGKSVIAREFAEMLGYSIEPVMLYQDMTARDLLQQRYTLPNGDTAWRPSPLVIAAMEGKLLILDGIHRVNLGTLAVLSRLLHDRELDLYDGTRLLQWDRYQTLKEQLQFSDQQLQERYA
ncbi:hypothetical protein GOODEAATRI_019010, partial [Goodea atripinnis]